MPATTADRDRDARSVRPLTHIARARYIEEGVYPPEQQAVPAAPVASTPSQPDCPLSKSSNTHPTHPEGPALPTHRDLGSEPVIQRAQGGGGGFELQARPWLASGCQCPGCAIDVHGGISERGPGPLAVAELTRSSLLTKERQRSCAAWTLLLLL